MEMINRQLNKCAEVMFLDGQNEFGEDKYTTGLEYAIKKQGPMPTYEFCDEWNAARGIDNDDWDRRLYPRKGLEALLLILTQDGRVFTSPQDGSPKVLVTDQSTVDVILDQRDEDRAIRQARQDRALELAAKWGDSEMAFMLFSTAIWFSDDDPGEGEMPNGSGVEFWQVGRNATHLFYMGVRRDADKVRFFQGVYEPDMANYPNEDAWSQREVSHFEGYYGHA